MNLKTVMSWLFWSVGLVMMLIVLFGSPDFLGFHSESFSPEKAGVVSSINASINNLWVTVSLILVVLMQPGFALVESGYIRSANTVNILFKNTIDFCLNGFFFFLIGYSLMWNGAFDVSQFSGEIVPGWLPIDYEPNGIVAPIHFLFQLVFATTAATICSGLVAGRISLFSYFVATIVISCVIYPIGGFWAWGAVAEGPIGFLNQMQYHDLAGSSVVHVVGGFAGLAGAIVLGPRLGRFAGDPRLSKLRKKVSDGEIEKIPGIERYDQGIHKPHNFSMVTLGTFLLWIAWFGFNGGSVLAMSNGSEKIVGFVLINTMLSACGGGITGAVSPFLSDWLLQTKHRIYSIDGMLNGILGGLVAITAGCDLIKDPIWSLLIGMAAGLIVHLTIYTFNNLPPGWKIDDPVGVFAVHGACGIFGVISCAFFPGFDDKLFQRIGTQLFGCFILAIWSFSVAFVLFWTMNKLNILRSKPEDEITGLDFTYHRQSAYTIEQ